MAWTYEKKGVSGVPAREFPTLEAAKEALPHLFREGGNYTIEEVDDKDGKGFKGAALYNGADTGMRLYDPTAPNRRTP